MAGGEGGVHGAAAVTDGVSVRIVSVHTSHTLLRVMQLYTLVNAAFTSLIHLLFSLPSGAVSQGDSVMVTLLQAKVLYTYKKRNSRADAVVQGWMRLDEQ